MGMDRGGLKQHAEVWPILRRRTGHVVAYIIALFIPP